MTIQQLEAMYEGNLTFKQMVDLFEAYLRNGLFTPGVLQDAVSLAFYRMRIVDPA